MTKIKIGCIADDFTGAADAASFLHSGGLRTILSNGIPSKDLPAEECQALVIALKTRNLSADFAVKESLEALEWLLKNGTGQIYLKYCSTFDSTPSGNIGPVADAFLERLGIRCTALCPSLPVNGRTVKNGCIFVHGIPLHESPMKDHPLTPMWDCRISELMKQQSIYPCFILNRELLDGSGGEIFKFIDKTASQNSRFYLVPDYETQEDGWKIVDIFGDCRLLTGGSGLLEELARHIVLRNGSANMAGHRKKKTTFSAEHGSDILILAGSCSAVTLKQISRYQEAGFQSVQIFPADVAEKEEFLPDHQLDFLSRLFREHRSGPLLIYSSDTPERVRESQKRFDSRKIAFQLENFMSRAAVCAYQNGFRNFIAAGGETSGAVAKALEFQDYLIGGSISPGIPVLTPVNDRNTRLVLKSGNFGTEDFFPLAIQKIRSCREDDYEYE